MGSWGAIVSEAGVGLGQAAGRTGCCGAVTMCAVTGSQQAPMYAKFFGLQQEPFSIAPDPRYLFMSERHREALAHLLYGVRGGGGFVLLTGEIGAGKTTVCRCFLEQIPERCNVAYIFNPKLTVTELLKTICDEFHVEHDVPANGIETVKQYIDPLNAFLLRTHATGQNNVLIIDEAQNLSAEVLEQLRLLTNLETSERKLLQIILIGQPELRDMLARPELEQLAQRVIARFHLEALSEAETGEYISHRLGVAGYAGPLLFDRKALRRIHTLARGVPRRVNLLCDRALLGAYAQGRKSVDLATLNKAAAEVFAPQADAQGHRAWPWAAGLVAVCAVGAVFVVAARMQDGKGARAAGASASASAVHAATAVAAPASAPASSIDLASAMAEPDAWRELARAWHAQALPPDRANQADPCQALKSQQLQCFKSDGGLAQARLLDRPAMLALHGADGATDGPPVYALLIGLGEQSATLRVGKTTQTVTLTALNRQWRGEFSTLWRAPPDYGSRIGAGPLADWLDAQLAKAMGDAPSGDAASHLVDAALQARVEAFQRTQGLRSDGRAGPITLMLLNRAAGVDEPRLLSSQHAAVAAR